MHGGSMAGHTMHPQQFHFTGNGVRPSRRASCSSVSSFVGIRFSTSTFSARPSFSVDSSSPSFSAVLRQATPAERKTEGSPEPSENRYFFDRLLFRECLPGPGHSKADTYTHMRIHSSWLSCTESPSAFSFRFDQMKPTFQVGKSICPFPCVVNGAGRYEDRFTFPFAPLAGMFFL